MVLIGFLAFLDPPKETTRDAIHALREYGVGVKILTGDNEKVTCAICRQVGMNAERVLLGADIDAMDDETLAQAAEEITVFAKLSPAQKARVVTVLRQKGHSVGYMGDGINDAAAMKAVRGLADLFQRCDREDRCHGHPRGSARSGHEG